MRIEAGQAAVVTGAASGIGRAMALELAARGVHVVVADLAEDGVDSVAEEIVAAGGQAMPAAVDVTDARALHELARRAIEHTGHIELVVNNAGIVPNPAPMWELDLADWRRVVEVNLFGVMNGIRAFVPHLVAAGRGHVINTASVAGLIGTPWSSAYGISKHGVVAASENLRAELDLAGVQVGVTVVCPGYVRTPMVEQMLRRLDEPEAREQLDPDLHASMVNSLTEILEPDEAARRVFAAVEAEQLYALPTGDVQGGARARAERVLQALDAAEAD